jgi:hypothetical protein
MGGGDCLCGHVQHDLQRMSERMKFVTYGVNFMAIWLTMCVDKQGSNISSTCIINFCDWTAQVQIQNVSIEHVVPQRKPSILAFDV